MDVESTYHRGSDDEDDDEDRRRQFQNYQKLRTTHAVEDDDADEAFDEGEQKKAATIELASVVRTFKNEPVFTEIPRGKLVSAVGEGRERRLEIEGPTRSKHRAKQRTSRSATKSERTGWEQPPHVDSGAVDDYMPMISEKYEGTNETTARKDFKKCGLDWDSMDSETFRSWIADMKQSRKLSDRLSSAFFLFCDLKIDKSYRLGWVLAVKDAHDQHENEDSDEDD
jgi:hypothetical protein